VKRGLFILLTALLLGACMFYCSRFLLEPTSAPAAQDMAQENGSMLPELQWLREWLHLSEPQFAEVEALHLAYLPKCRLNCARIAEAEAALLEAAGRPMKELGERLQELATAQMTCRLAMIEHVRQTASCLNQEQARQYLDVLLPHVLGLSRHCGACPTHPPRTRDD
jgi:hypothetical protein